MNLELLPNTFHHPHPTLPSKISHETIIHENLLNHIHLNSIPYSDTSPISDWISYQYQSHTYTPPLPTTHHTQLTTSPFSYTTHAYNRVVAQAISRLRACVVDYVEVPYLAVGLIVGHKGSTIKHLQERSGANIISPSREMEPIFTIIAVSASIVESTKKIILDFIHDRLTQINEYAFPSFSTTLSPPNTTRSMGKINNFPPFLCSDYSSSNSSDDNSTSKGCSHNNDAFVTRDLNDSFTFNEINVSSDFFRRGRRFNNQKRHSSAHNREEQDVETSSMNPPPSSTTTAAINNGSETMIYMHSFIPSLKGYKYCQFNWLPDTSECKNTDMPNSVANNTRVGSDFEGIYSTSSVSSTYTNCVIPPDHVPSINRMAFSTSYSWEKHTRATKSDGRYYSYDGIEAGSESHNGALDFTIGECSADNMAINECYSSQINAPVGHTLNAFPYCVMCCDGDHFIKLSPCNHGPFCIKCGQKFIQNKKPCPICEEKIEDTSLPWNH